MRPGDVQIGRGKKSFVVAFRIWAKKVRKDIYIHITCDRKNLKHITVCDNPNSKKRYHRVLFRDLKKLLVEHERWPYG